MKGKTRNPTRRNTSVTRSRVNRNVTSQSNDKDRNDRDDDDHRLKVGIYSLTTVDGNMHTISRQSSTSYCSGDIKGDLLVSR